MVSSDPKPLGWPVSISLLSPALCCCLCPMQMGQMCLCGQGDQGRVGGGVYSLQGQQDTDFHLRPQYSQLLCFVLLCFVSFSISHCMLVMGPLSDAGLQKQLPKAMLVLLGVLLGKVGKTGSLRSGPGTGSPPKVQPFPPSCT